MLTKGSLDVISSVMDRKPLEIVEKGINTICVFKDLFGFWVKKRNHLGISSSNPGTEVGSLHQSCSDGIVRMIESQREQAEIPARMDVYRGEMERWSQRLLGIGQGVLCGGAFTEMKSTEQSFNWPSKQRSSFYYMGQELSKC